MLAKIFALFLFSVSVTEAVAVSELRSDGYICETSLGSCYKFHRRGLTWSRAFQSCVAESAHLAIINSQNEAVYLKNLVATVPACSMTADHKDFGFIGFFAADEPPVWMTIKGHSLKYAGYSAWGPGQPDNSTVFRRDGETCGSLIFKANSYENGKFNDVSCEKTLTYICEKSMMGDEHITYFITN